MYTVEDWVADLRSGKYKQWKGMLQCDGGYCCLGVLAANLEVEGIVRHKNKDGFVYYEHKIDGSADPALFSSVIPQRMAAAVGLRSMSGAFYVRRMDHALYARVLDNIKDKSQRDAVEAAFAADSTISLAALNDYGVPFEVIADIIESRPERLFVDGT